MDEAASLIENARLGILDGVWEAREYWSAAACRWLEGEEDLEVVLEAAEGFVSAVEAVVPPYALRPVYPFNDSDEPVLLYAGPMSVMLEQTSAEPIQGIEARGESRVYFEFLPTPRVTWQTVVEVVHSDLLGAFFSPTREKPVFPQFGEPQFAVPPDSGTVADLPNVKDRGGMDLTGIVSSEQVGDSDQLSTIRFNLINFPLERGTDLVLHPYGDRSTSEEISKAPKYWLASHRLRLHADGWEVDIDARRDISDIWKQTEDRGSFAFTHTGRVRCLNLSTFSFEQAKDLLNALHWFLSFVMGARVGIALPVGFDHCGIPICTEWSSPVVDAPMSYIGWRHDLVSADLPALFEVFHRYWKDEYWQGVIRQVVDAYTFAKKDTPRDKVVTTQTALETLAWAVLVIDHKWLTKREFKSLASAARIRRLLEWAGVPTEVPADQSALAVKAQSMKGHRDGPQAIAWVRNKIVHPTPSPAKGRISRKVWLEAHRVALWYLEMVLLRLFEYRGDYVNWPKGMGSGAGLSDCIEKVPWATSEP